LGRKGHWVGSEAQLGSACVDGSAQAAAHRPARPTAPKTGRLGFLAYRAESGPATLLLFFLLLFLSADGSGPPVGASLLFSSSLFLLCFLPLADGFAGFGGSGEAALVVEKAG